MTSIFIEDVCFKSHIFHILCVGTKFYDRKLNYLLKKSCLRKMHGSYFQGMKKYKDNIN